MIDCTNTTSPLDNLPVEMWVVKYVGEVPQVTRMWTVAYERWQFVKVVIYLARNEAKATRITQAPTTPPPAAPARQSP